MTSERRLEAVEKQRQALELRKAGLSYPKIADSLGYEGPSGAYQAVMSALDKTLREPAEEVRKLELDRIDHLQSLIWSRLLAGDDVAFDKFMRLSQHRCKIQGIYAPAKMALVNPNNEKESAFVQKALASDDTRELLALLSDRLTGLAGPVESAGAGGNGLAGALESRPAPQLPQSLPAGGDDRTPP